LRVVWIYPIDPPQPYAGVSLLAIAQAAAPFFIKPNAKLCSMIHAKKHDIAKKSVVSANVRDDRQIGYAFLE
jgi:hypothetical protein